MLLQTFASHVHLWKGIYVRLPVSQVSFMLNCELMQKFFIGIEMLVSISLRPYLLTVGAVEMWKHQPSLTDCFIPGPFLWDSTYFISCSASDIAVLLNLILCTGNSWGNCQVLYSSGTVMIWPTLSQLKSLFLVEAISLIVRWVISAVMQYNVRYGGLYRAIVRVCSIGSGLKILYNVLLRWKSPNMNSMYHWVLWSDLKTKCLADVSMVYCVAH